MCRIIDIMSTHPCSIEETKSKGGMGTLGFQGSLYPCSLALMLKNFFHSGFLPNSSKISLT